MNLLWIMTDQHRADCLGCMGNDRILTPNLDRIGAEGIVFENAFCQSPVCMASRANLFTGRYPSTTGMRGMGILPPSETTFPELLERNGYRTAAFGKVHLTPEKYVHGRLGSETPILDWRRFAKDAAMRAWPDDPLKRSYGFDIHEGCDDACQGNFHAWLRERGREPAPRPEPLFEDGPNDLFVSPYPSELHQSRYIATRTDAFLRERSADEPWLAFCSFVAPHHPFEAPADQIGRYDGVDLPEPSCENDMRADLIPEPMRSALGEWERYPPEARRAVVAHYYASVSLVDDCVGMLLGTLEEEGLLDDTAILFTADHGEFLGNHGLLRKPSIHCDDLLRVPLLLRAPGLTPRRVDGLMELTDVFPTLAGLLGMPIPPGVQGVDWSEALLNGNGPDRDDIYSDMFELTPMVFDTPGGPYGGCMTLRTRDWKLDIYPKAGREYGRLVHLADDPEERRNLYDDPAYAAVREELLWRMAARIHDQADPLPLRLTQW